jgi:hypothetical protein
VRTGYTLLIGALLSGLILIWTKIPEEIIPNYRNKHRAVGTVVLLVIVSLLGLFGRYQANGEEQRDTAEHLGFEAFLPSQDNIRSTIVKLTNGGKTGIKYSFICHIKLLVANKGRTVIGESDFRDHERAGTLEAGTDKQYDDCLSALSLPTNILECVDIQVKVSYFLETQPSAVQKPKEHGFVIRKIGSQFEWEDRAAEQEVSNCAKFAHVPPPPWEIFKQNVAAIRSNNLEVLRVTQPNLGGKKAARLSEALFNFADKQANTFPKEANEPRGPDMNPTIDKVMQWQKVTDSLFEADYRRSLNAVFQEAGKRHMETTAVKTWCNCKSTMRSIDERQECAYGIGIIAKEMPF